MKQSFIISGVYIVFGLCWIYFTDDLVFALFSDNTDLLHKIEHIKGFLFVFASGILILFLTQSLYSRLFRRNEERSLLLSSEKMAFIVLDSKGLIVEANKTFQTITGYSDKVFKNLNIKSLFGKEDTPILDQITSTEGMMEKDCWLMDAQNNWINVNVKAISRKNSFQESDLTVMVIEDNSERLKHQAVLEKMNQKLTQGTQELYALNQAFSTAKSKAEEANRMKSSFIKKLSHEIRTPLNGMIGSTELLKEYLGQVDESITDLIDIQKESSLRLLDTLEGILEKTAEEYKTYEQNLVPVNLQNVIDSAFDSLRNKAAEKQMMLRFMISPNCPDTVLGQERPLFQIIKKLTENAIKFSGGTELKVLVSCSDEKNRVKIIVSDDGKGISEDDISKVFEPFHQDVESALDSYAGSGIGLTLVKKYTELIGGSIEVENNIDGGARFTISLNAVEEAIYS